MILQVAERFKSIQGEGVHVGVAMAFVRFVGCSVGKGVCTFCDTDFDRVRSWRGGGMYTTDELIAWTKPFQHVCFTGGEPLDQDVAELVKDFVGPMDSEPCPLLHFETSGTKMFPDLASYWKDNVWICVSPKPGWLPAMIEMADEIKVIVPGLSDRPGWPTLEDAVRWADEGRTVFLQPRNGRTELNRENLQYVVDVVKEHPQLRLSAQLHKMLFVR